LPVVNSVNSPAVSVQAETAGKSVSLSRSGPAAVSAGDLRNPVSPSAKPADKDRPAVAATVSFPTPAVSVMNDREPERSTPAQGEQVEQDRFSPQGGPEISATPAGVYRPSGSAAAAPVSEAKQEDVPIVPIWLLAVLAALSAAVLYGSIKFVSLTARRRAG
jgi:hypothetical protein